MDTTLIEWVLRRFVLGKAHTPFYIATAAAFFVYCCFELLAFVRLVGWKLSVWITLYFELRLEGTLRAYWLAMNPLSRILASVLAGLGP